MSDMDIVAELRQVYGEVDELRMMDPVRYVHAMRAAADEIERLRGGVEAEREACAKVAKRLQARFKVINGKASGKDIAAAIRERAAQQGDGNTKLTSVST